MILGTSSHFMPRYTDDNKHLIITVGEARMIKIRKPLVFVLSDCIKNNNDNKKCCDYLDKVRIIRKIGL